MTKEGRFDRKVRRLPIGHLVEDQDGLIHRHVETVVDEKLVGFVEILKKGIEEVMDRRFDEFEQKIDAKMDQRFGDMQQQMDQRFDHVDQEIVSLQKQIHLVASEQQADIKAILQLLETQYEKKITVGK